MNPTFPQAIQLCSTVAFTTWTGWARLTSWHAPASPTPAPAQPPSHGPRPRSVMHRILRICVLCWANSSVCRKMEINMQFVDLEMDFTVHLATWSSTLPSIIARLSCFWFLVVGQSVHGYDYFINNRTKIDGSFEYWTRWAISEGGRRVANMGRYKKAYPILDLLLLHHFITTLLSLNFSKQNFCYDTRPHILRWCATT